jgi:hypothetical protein
VQHPRRTTRFAWLLLPFALAACKSSDTTSPPGDNPRITLQLSVSALPLLQGAAGSLVATIARAGGFTGAVNLVIEGAPGNVNIVANPASLPSGTSSATINVTAGATAAVGTTTITVRAQGDGVSAQTATFTLTISAPQAGSFTMNLTSAALTIQQGSQATTTLNVTRTNFAASIAFTATGAPNGMTPTFNPTNTTGNSTTLTVVVGASVATGNHTLTLRGTSGTTEQSVQLVVTVTASSGGGGNTRWTFCAASGVAAFFAFQDGTGPWTAVTGANNVYNFNISSARGAIAYVTTNGNNSTLTVQYGSAQELNQQGTNLCGTTPAGKTINGSVANVGAQETSTITLGNATAVVNASTGNNFVLQNVRDGALDLVAGRSMQSIGAGGLSIVMNKGIIRRGLNQAAGSTLPVLDFNAAEAFTPVTRNVTINNLNGEFTTLSSTYLTAGGTSGSLYTEATANTNVTRPYYGVPQANQQNGDLHFFAVTAIAGLTTATTARTIMSVFRNPVDFTLTLGSVIGNIATTVAATTPYAMLRSQYTIQAEYNSYWLLQYVQSAAGATRSVSIGMTAAYQGSGTTVDITIPNLSTVAGWNNAWGLVVGQAVSWIFSAWGWTGIGSGGTSTPALEGSTSRNGVRFGTITP